jgi:hypothetical protein
MVKKDMEDAKEASRDAWLVKVKFIAGIPRKHKLGTLTNMYQHAVTWSTAFTRTIHGESSDLTDSYIKEVYTTGKTIYSVSTTKEEKKYILGQILTLLPALQKLESVYFSDKPEMASRMQVLSDKIKLFCESVTDTNKVEELKDIGSPELKETPQPPTASSEYHTTVSNGSRSTGDVIHTPLAMVPGPGGNLPTFVLDEVV